MRQYLWAALLLAATSTANAVKMKPGLATIRQSDGTTLSVRAFGDEDFSYFVASDGTLLYHEGTDFYIATVANDGTLSPTDVLAHEPKQRTVKETSLIAKQDRQLFFKNMNTTATANRLKRERIETNSTLLPHIGSPRIPVLLVEFSDSTFKFTDPKSVFNDYLNASEVTANMGHNYGSVRQYFSDMSFGKFTPQFDVYGPYNLGQPLARYGKGNSSNEHMDYLLADACTAADDDVDFSQYDSNGDGYIDLIYIIYAGYSQSISGNSTDCIHPKSGTTSVSKSFDGKKVARYGVNNELNGTPANQSDGWLINGIGLFCHEFSHCMGLPDMYPTPGSIAEQCINQNMDYWDLLDAGEYTYNGYRPTEYTAWEREAFDWMTIDTLNSAADITLLPLSEGGKAYRILNDNNSKEYYILENVQKKGWNSSVLGHGLLVSHVDYDYYQFLLGGCKVNSTAGHPRMTVMAADGMFVPEYYIGETIKEPTSATLMDINAVFTEKYLGQTFTQAMYRAEQAGDTYPGTSGATELTDSSSPMNAWAYTGSMGKPITDIKEDETTGAVSFKFMGGTPSGIVNAKRDIIPTSPLIYSLDGRQLGTDKSRLKKGVYIIGNRKVVL